MVANNVQLCHGPKVKLLELTFEDGAMWSLVRPGAQELIQSLAPRCELVMWPRVRWITFTPTFCVLCPVFEAVC